MPRTRVLFHGTPATLTGPLSDLCLTQDPAVAAAYLWGAAGTVYLVSLAANRVADESDIRAAAEAVGVPDITGYVYDLADDRRVREALAAAGYDVLVYEDVSPDNRRSHQTWRVIAPTCATVVAQVPVAAGADVDAVADAVWAVVESVEH
jgi:hypothetical protein